MSYPKIIDFGASLNKNIEKPWDTSNPLTYCLFSNLSTQFLHGSTSATYKPWSIPCQIYMAMYAAGEYDEANIWDKWCELYYYVNTDTYWPNTGSENTIPAVIANICGRNLTLGEYLLRNAAQRRFFVFPHKAYTLIPFDPNTANSPLIDNQLNNINGQTFLVNINPSKIDNDRLMNAVLENPSACSDILAYLHREYITGKLNLNNTKLGSYLVKNKEHLNMILTQLYKANPNINYVGYGNPAENILQGIANQSGFTYGGCQNCTTNYTNFPN